MIAARDALSAIMATVRPVIVDEVDVADGSGRVLAEAVTAGLDLPPWDNSAMDGYAVRSDDVRGVVSLSITETVFAGGMPSRALGAGQAARVMTGAPLPDGADAVVPVEESDRAEHGVVRLDANTSRGRFVRRRGSDVRAGELVLAPGRTLGLAEVGIAASLGHASLRVAARPRVVVLTTGDEVVRPGLARSEAQIWSSNHASLWAMVKAAGAEPVDGGHVGDDVELLASAVASAVEAGDAVVTTGGVSAGARDHLRGSLAGQGYREVFWKVRVKPGMPLLFSVAKGVVPVFGLPGNPVSCMVNFLQFVRPWIRSSLGDQRPFLPVFDAIAAEDIPSAPGRARFERVRVDVREGRFEVRTTGDQSSGILRSMVDGQGLMLLDPDHPGPRMGDRVRFQPLGAGWGGAAEPGYTF
jgi:molybdopterin molybdotransferase